MNVLLTIDKVYTTSQRVFYWRTGLGGLSPIFDNNHSIGTVCML